MKKGVSFSWLNTSIVDITKFIQRDHFLSFRFVCFRFAVKSSFPASSHGVQFPGVAPAFPYLRLSFRVRGSNYSKGTKNHEPRTSL